MEPYFTRNSRDAEFYDEYIRERLPRSIFDIHVHLNLPEHIAMVPESRWESDWALKDGHLLPCEDAYACAAELYPDIDYRIAGFPWPILEADLHGNNKYLATLRRKWVRPNFLLPSGQRRHYFL